MIMLILIGIIPAIVTASIVVRGYSSRAVSLRTGNVKIQCDMLCNSIVTEGYMDNLRSPLLNAELTLMTNVYSGRFMIVDSDFTVIRDTFDLDTNKTTVTKEVLNCFSTGRSETFYDEKNAYIEVISPITDPKSGETIGVLVASVSTNEIAQTVRDMENQTLFIVAVISILVLIGGYFIAELLVKPFRGVTRAIEDVTDGYEDQAISVSSYTETEQILEAFNNMLTRVRALDNSRNEFVSNVSHELKTPLTSMKVLADSLNGMGDVPPELYKEFMADIAQEIDRENNIITNLLSMVRMDRKAAAMNWEKEEIGLILEQIIKRLRPIAEKKEVTITLEPYKVVVAEVDEMKLSLALTNLIENAVKYNVDGGWVKVNLKSDARYFYVTVSDCGLGIPEDQIDHVFERFYRGDKSHSTTIEGTGLGLAITKSAITLHHGNVKVKSKVGEGSVFMVRIPLERRD